MYWILAAALTGAPSTVKKCSFADCERTQAVRVTARVVRAGQADQQSAIRHPAHRVRRVIDVQPNGQRIELIVLDFE